MPVDSLRVYTFIHPPDSLLGDTISRDTGKSRYLMMMMLMMTMTTMMMMMMVVMILLSYP